MIKRRDSILKKLKSINGYRLKQILKGYAQRFLLNLIGKRMGSEVTDFIKLNLSF